jgi:prophage regulatory protein
MPRFIRRKAVEERTGLARSTIYQMVNEGRFPRPVRLGGRAVAWLENEVNDWVDARITERGEG